MRTSTSQLDIIFAPPQAIHSETIWAPKESIESLEWHDHYLLEKLATELDGFTPRRTLIVNDSFGALTIPLIQLKPDVIINSARTTSVTEKLVR